MAAPVTIAMEGEDSFRICRGAWSDVMALSRLSGWLHFYRKLAKKRPDIYQPYVDAIEDFQKSREGRP